MTETIISGGGKATNERNKSLKQPVKSLNYLKQPVKSSRGSTRPIKKPNFFTPPDFKTNKPSKKVSIKVKSRVNPIELVYVMSISMHEQYKKKANLKTHISFHYVNS